jgi:hypothetical protein
VLRTDSPGAAGSPEGSEEGRDMFAGALRRVVGWCLSWCARLGAGRSAAGVTALAVLAGFGTLAVVGMPAGATQGAAAGMAPVASAPGGGEEVAGLRTRTSRRYRRPDGSLVARVWAAPVNYRDAQGAWQAIDDSRVASGAC